MWHSGRAYLLFATILIGLAAQAAAAQDNSALVSALDEALEKGDVAAAEAVIKRGLDVNVKLEGWTPLIVAAAHSSPRMVQMLLDRGARVNLKGPDGITPLISAVSTAQAATIPVLIKAGADLNGKDESGNTALIYAAAAGNLEIVETLVKAGADLNIEAGGFTALDRAARANKPEVVAFLRRALAPAPTEAAQNRNTERPVPPRERARRPSPSPTNTTTEPARTGSDSNQTDAEKTAAARNASDSNKTDAEKNAEANQGSPQAAKKGETKNSPDPPFFSLADLFDLSALLDAAPTENKKSAATSPTNFLNLPDRDPKPTQPVDLSVAMRLSFHGEDLAALKKCGDLEGEARWVCADMKLVDVGVNNADWEGTTFLMIAAASGNTRFAKLLLAHDADPSLTNKKGETALAIAEKNNHSEVIQLLRQARAK